MHIDVGTLIIGAGYSGLILQSKLKSLGHSSIIIERGYSNGYTDSDYVIFTKSEFPFSGEVIDVNINRASSGAVPFHKEYTKKVYNRSLPEDDVKLFSGESERMKGITIDNEYLLKDSRVYGNIDITSIDYQNKIAKGRVLHMKEEVTINYSRLISTIPIHRFMKLVDMNFLKAFGLFISYFPIGIQKVTSTDFREEMSIEYVSDPTIPYYRKQMYGQNIFYEYCLNKPMDIRFSAVVVPGKFTKQEPDIMERFYKFFDECEIYFAGRFATWDPDFLLDNVWQPDETLSNKFLSQLYRDIQS